MLVEYEKTGVISLKELESNFPSRSRLEKGSVAIIECIQAMPCDPCVKSCKFGAIHKKSLTTPPELDFEKCLGCGNCISSCPGLAIFVVNLNQKQSKAILMMPYELLPTPRKGQIYEALDREGNPIGEANIIATKVQNDHTCVVTLSLKKDIIMEVRNIGRQLNA